MDMATAIGIGLGAAAGGWAGYGSRLLLRRLRRGARVPAPWCELAVGAGWALAGGLVGSARAGPGWVALLLATSWFAVTAAAVDLRHRRLPDALTLPALPAAVAAVVPLGAPAVLRAVLGAALLMATHALVHFAAPASLGAGDVKLSGSVGAVLGAVSLPAVLLGTVLAALISVLAAGVPAGLAAARSSGSLVRRDRAVVGARRAVVRGDRAVVRAGWVAERSGGTAAGSGDRAVGSCRPAVPHGASMLAACVLVLVLSAGGLPW